jgi:hypothetical protein
MMAGQAALKKQSKRRGITLNPEENTLGRGVRLGRKNEINKRQA